MDVESKRQFKPAMLFTLHCRETQLRTLLAIYVWTNTFVKIHLSISWHVTVDGGSVTGTTPR